MTKVIETPEELARRILRQCEIHRNRNSSLQTADHDAEQLARIVLEGVEREREGSLYRPAPSSLRTTVKGEKATATSRMDGKAAKKSTKEKE